MTWEEYFVIAEEYYRENGDLEIPQKYVTDNGVKLGMWIKTQRRAYNGSNKVSINDKQIKKLESIGMVWKLKKRNQWDEYYEEAKKYYLENGNLLVPHEYKTTNGYNLGYWISDQRAQYKKNKINEENVILLNSIDMVWRIVTVHTWDEVYEKAKDYFNDNGDLLVPQNYEDSEGFGLGIWITNQRIKYKKHELTEEQIKMLESIGMVWIVKQKRAWEDYYEYALQYYEQHLNLLVSVDYEVDGIKLGSWLANQRRARKANKLNQYQIELLDNIEMVWEMKRRTVAKKG